MITAFIEESIKELGLPLQSVTPKMLQTAYVDLSSRYRAYTHNPSDTIFKTALENLVYLYVRIPATFAVLNEIFKNNFSFIPSRHITCLDIGSGPGIAGFAFSQHAQISSLTMIEQDANFARLSLNALTKLIPDCPIQSIHSDLNKTDFTAADFVCMSYILMELSPENVLPVYQKSLDATMWRNLVVLPGTPKAHQLLLKLRDTAIHMGFRIIAPCPHHNACPFTAMHDTQWCHFQQHVVRSEIHQFIKDGAIGYELEPYCYLIVERITNNTTTIGADHETIKGRVIQTPSHKKGHIYLDLCTHNGCIEKRCISKKDGDLYSYAKKREWGDAFSPE